MSTLAKLLEAKEKSDGRQYGAKASIMARLLREKPHEFLIDQVDPRGGHPGVVHVPTGFKMHIPQRYIPVEVVKNTDRAVKLLEDADKDEYLGGFVRPDISLGERKWIYDGDQIAGFMTPRTAVSPHDGWKYNRVGAVYMDPNHRGKGLARKAIEDYSKDKPVVAYIRDGNEGSERAFERAGFVKKDREERWGGGHWWRNRVADEELMEGEEKSASYIRPSTTDAAASALASLLTGHSTRRPTRQEIEQQKEEEERWIQSLPSTERGRARLALDLQSRLTKRGNEKDPSCKAIFDDRAREVKKASAQRAPLAEALASIDLDALEAEQKDILKNGPKTKRRKAAQTLGVIQGLRRNEVKPEELLIRNVPVIPPQFRPFSAAGSTFIPGDANVLYKELMDLKADYEREVEEFGEAGAAETKKSLYRAIRAVYGYGEPVGEKTRSKGVSGFMQKVLGSGPKYSYLSRRLLGKTQDSTGRGTIIVDPDLDLDEIGIPEEMAWRMYSPYIQRRLVRAGMSPTDALKNIEDRSDHAKRALQQESDDRWIVYSRAPVWHKYGVLSGKPKLIEGNAIAINPFVTTGLNADFDGDAMNLHLPSLPDAVEEARTKLKPSAMLLKTRDPDEVMPAPKQEQILGLYRAQHRPARNVHQFGTHEEALQAIESGRVSLSDEVEIAEPSELLFPDNSDSLYE